MSAGENTNQFDSGDRYSNRYRDKALAAYGNVCVRCGEEYPPENLEVHHVDRDKTNSRLDNLEPLCKEHHRAEHHDSPLWGLVVNMPRPVLETLDKAVEENGMYSRSEAVARAIVAAYDNQDEGFMGSAEESVVCWFGDDRHTKWVTDSAVEPPDSGEGP